MAKYSEEGADYVENMQRLLRKFETAKRLVPAPVIRNASEPTRVGVIYYGSTSAAMEEALESLSASGVALDTCRVRAFPFAEAIVDFVLAHDRVFVVEQNRDAQLRALLINECALDPARLMPILHYDGTPITARFIVQAIDQQWRALSGAAHRDAAE
jgi:2-oxoglutarate ferredoxin oxidoreductase subunit alpha